MSTKQRTSLTQERLGGWRQAKDSLTNFTITAGGMGVLVAILLIFFYLLYEIVPLFKSASLEPLQTYSVAANGDVLYLAMEEQAEVAMQLDRGGQVQFFFAEDGATIKQFQLPVEGAITSFALNSEQQPLFAVAANNQVVLAAPKYKISYPNDQRLISPILEYPYGEVPISLGEGTITQLVVRDTDDEMLLIAKINRQLQGVRQIKEEDFLTEEVVLREERLNLPEVDINIDWLLVGPDQRWLYLISKSGDYRVISLADEEVIDAGRFFDGDRVTDVRFLLGDISLLVASDQGEVVQTFMVRQPGKTPRLRNIRQFQQSDTAIKQLVVEHRRKGFVTLDQNNEVSIYHTTSGRHLLAKSVAANTTNIQQLALAPRADALLSRTQSGEFTYWDLYNEHPEVSWQALWEKVWYESYPEPDYIWQSSASNTDFEAKYSFTPLAFGTLKAAFYAMLIATPLALCGAIYTAYFMAPTVRRKVKPLVELMEALPTVILGFLAGLWLAPFMERNLPGVFSIFLMMPIGVLMFGFAWSRLPNKIRLSVPDGWHPILLIPVVIFICWGCVAASGILEVWFFHGDMRAWLTHDLGISYDQRNAMVVGVAMGFAVVPTIFSIAEDAIFSVPKSLSYGSLALGATPWQTLIGVIIPTASPGIFSALMIGMGRAVGETMIVLMATGNTPVMDANIFEGMRTLAANIAVEIGETEVDSSHFRVLFLAAFVLFLFTFAVNTVAEVVRQRLRKKYGSL
ncbi:ABC transporter permease subunit [Oceanicoccus sp. KOV_DT_Chl]|uniref:ABC transporter permease subunit n=1 Tax=Oceanicoccus sp. KOV_DT_Chl TaxID=1904639 RepID=UPI00190E6C91|nr:ABC transporter permease subunit [Oceanicoccus sp. KOV_DT_Chl]